MKQMKYTAKTTKKQEASLNIIKQEKKKKNENLSQTAPEIPTEEKKLHIAQVVVDSQNNDDNNQNNSNPKYPKAILKINPNSKKSVKTDNVKIFSKFTESESIKLVVRRIEEKKKLIEKMKKEGKHLELTFFSKDECIIQNQDELFNPKKMNDMDYSIIDLVNASQFLIANLIAKASDSTCPFLSTILH